MTLARQYKTLLAKAPPKKPNLLEQGKRHTAQVVLPNARVGGLLLVIPSGGGKSIFLGKQVAMVDAVQKTPQVIIDVGGQCIANFLHQTLFLSERQQREILSRVVYCDMSGTDGFVTSWPLLQNRTPHERLYVTASRLPELLGLLDDKFANATIQGLTRAIPIAVATGKLLAALNLPITDVFALLRHPEQWTDRIKQAVRQHPEAASAAQDLFDYMAIPQRQRQERIEPFLNRLQLLRHDEVSRALFGSVRKPSIDLAAASHRSQTVLVDLSRIASPFAKQFALQFVFQLLAEYVSSRGRGKPFSVVIDELASFVTGEEYLNTRAIAHQFRKLIEQHMRNNSVQLTLATQDLKQIPPEMLSAVLNMKNMLFGSQSDPETAEYLANRFMKKNPWEVKHWRKVWATENFGHGYIRHVVLDYEPEFMPLTEQNYLNAREFMELPKGTFLFAKSIGEGEVATAVRRVSAQYLFRPPFVSDNSELLAKLRLYLTRRDGIPITEMLREIDAVQHLPSSGSDVRAETKPAVVSGNGQHRTAWIPEQPPETVTANGTMQTQPDTAAPQEQEVANAGAENPMEQESGQPSVAGHQETDGGGSRFGHLPPEAFV